MSKWTEEELEELENDPDQWDWENAEIVEPSPNRGAIVSVSMPSAIFRRIARCADAKGESLPQCFLNAAVERVEREERAAREALPADRATPEGQPAGRESEEAPTSH